MYCHKCQFPYESSDAFCRKCGAPVSQDSSNSETPATSDRTVLTGEIIEVNSKTPGNNLSRELAQTAGKQLFSLSKKAGSKMVDALKSEQGKKLTRTATAAAVAVGMELLTHAVNRSNQQNSKTSGERSLQKPERPPANLAEAMLKAFEDRISPADDPEDAAEYIEERIYIRRIIRRR